MIKEKNEKRERGEKEDRYYFYLLVFGSGFKERGSEGEGRDVYVFW